MTEDQGQDDDILAALASLRRRDISPRRALRLRCRCHTVLQAKRGPAPPAAMAVAVAFQRVIGPALGGAWCLAYLMEIVRRAAAVYFGAH